MAADSAAVLTWFVQGVDCPAGLWDHGSMLVAEEAT